MNTYKLGSNGLIWTPGIMRWARNAFMHGDKHDKKAAMDVIASYKGIPHDVMQEILICTDKQFEAMVDNEEGTVTVTI